MFSFQTRKEHKENYPHILWGVDSINVFDRSNFFSLLQAITIIFYKRLQVKNTMNYKQKLQVITIIFYKGLQAKNTMNYKQKLQVITSDFIS